jgi:pimeloyl-ACP methyl ester carboxylesterase
MHLFRRGSGYPILFIHGIPTSNRLWSGIIEQLCGDFTCFAVDLPGLGKTPGEPYRPDYLQRMAQRIDALRISNNIEQWHVVGHDAGSAIAAHYAHSFQPHVGRLALLSPALFPDLKPYFPLQLLRRPVLGECLAPFVHPLFWHVAMRRAVRNEEGMASPPSVDFRAPFLGFYGAWQFMRIVRWGKPADVFAHFSNILPQLLMPTLIFQGLRDPAIPHSFACRAHKLIPNSELLHVDSGHFIPLNRPAFVAGRLQRFFAEPDPLRTFQQPPLAENGIPGKLPS